MQNWLTSSASHTKKINSYRQKGGDFHEETSICFFGCWLLWLLRLSLRPHATFLVSAVRTEVIERRITPIRASPKAIAKRIQTLTERIFCMSDYDKNKSTNYRIRSFPHRKNCIVGILRLHFFSIILKTKNCTICCQTTVWFFSLY